MNNAVDPTGLLAALAMIPGVGPYLVYAPLVIAVCKIITVVCPPPAAGSRWLGIYRLVSAIALNLGHATNAVPPGLPASVVERVEAAAAVTAAVPVAAEVQKAAEVLVHEVKS